MISNQIYLDHINHQPSEIHQRSSSINASTLITSIHSFHHQLPSDRMSSMDPRYPSARSLVANLSLPSRGPVGPMAAWGPLEATVVSSAARWLNAVLPGVGFIYLAS